MRWLGLHGQFQPPHTPRQTIKKFESSVMRYLYQGQCFATIEILMDAIYESFFRTGSRHASGSRPSAKLEHLKATHNWTAWLTTACAEQDAEKSQPAVRKIERYARRVPDSHRPHEFEFSKMIIEGCPTVVVNYSIGRKTSITGTNNPLYCSITHQASTTWHLLH